MKILKFLTIAFVFFLTTNTYAQHSFTKVVNLTVTNGVNAEDCSHEIALMIDYNFNGTTYTQISNTVSMGPSNQSTLLSVIIPKNSTITAKKVKFTKAGGTTIVHDLSHTMTGDNISGYCSNEVIMYESSTMSSTTWGYWLDILF